MNLETGVQPRIPTVGNAGGATGDDVPTSTEPGVFMTALAMDLDHTLWATANNSPGDPGNGDLYHYASDGTFLGKETPAFTLLEALGGEIALVPESGAGAAALGVLAALAGVWSWKRQRTQKT